MQENRVMTEAEMAMAKATGAKSVTITEESLYTAPDMTPSEFLELNEIRSLRYEMEKLVSPLNTSHGLALGWRLEDDLRMVKNLIDLKREQLDALEEVHYNLRRKIRNSSFELEDLG